jgi:hypothetical protein
LDDRKEPEKEPEEAPPPPPPPPPPPQEEEAPQLDEEDDSYLSQEDREKLKAMEAGLWEFGMPWPPRTAEKPAEKESPAKPPEEEPPAEEEPERVPTDDEALPELPPEYQPGGEEDIPLSLNRKADQPEEEREQLRKWWKYRAFTGLTRAQHNSRFIRKRTRTYSGGGFANFNLNDMIFRKQMIDADFTQERAREVIKRFKRLRIPLPAWPIGAPVPAALEMELERQQKADQKREAPRTPKPPPEYKKPPPREELSPEEVERRKRQAEFSRQSRERKKEREAKASPKSTARSSRG